MKKRAIFILIGLILPGMAALACDFSFEIGSSSAVTVVVTQVNEQSNSPTSAPLPQPATPEMSQPSTPQSGSPQPMPQPVETQPVLSGPKADIVNAIKAREAAQSVEAVIDQYVMNTTIQVVAQYVAPDRYHLKGVRVEVIRIADKFWWNVGGPWIESTPGTDLMAYLAMVHDPTGPASAAKFIKEARILRQEAVNREAATVYEYSFATGGDPSGQLTITMWISATRSLPLKAETDSEVSGQPMHTTVNYTYNIPISIQPPY